MARRRPSTPRNINLASPYQDALPKKYVGRATARRRSGWAASSRRMGSHADLTAVSDSRCKCVTRPSLTTSRFVIPLRAALHTITTVRGAKQPTTAAAWVKE